MAETAGLAKAAARARLGQQSQRRHHGHQYYILALLTLQPGNMSLKPVMVLWRPQLLTSLRRRKAKQHDLFHREAHCQNWSKVSRTEHLENEVSAVWKEITVKQIGGKKL